MFEKGKSFSSLKKNKKIKHLQVWRGEDFSRWIQVGLLKLDWIIPKDQKSSLKKFNSNFSTIVPFRLKKMYIGMTNWKRTESVKQEGKQSGVLKKVGKKYFFLKKKIGNFLLKYFFEKKIYSKTHHIHMVMHVCDAS